jgi:hypothetical protein
MVWGLSSCAAPRKRDAHETFDDRSTTTTETLMARKSKVSVSTEPTKHRLSSAERHAVRTAEIANKQSDLKREAAERRAKRAADAAAMGDAVAAFGVSEPASSGPSNTP